MEIFNFPMCAVLDFFCVCVFHHGLEKRLNCCIFPGSALLGFLAHKCYVYVCEPPLISLPTAWLISVTSPSIQKSAAVLPRVCSSVIDEVIRSPSSEYPASSKSEILLGPMVPVRRKAQQSPYQTVINSS